MPNFTTLSCSLGPGRKADSSRPGQGRGPSCHGGHGGSLRERSGERGGAQRCGERAGGLRGWAHGVSGCFPAGGAPPGTVVLPRSCPAPPACPAVPASPRRRARSLRLEGQGPAWARGVAGGGSCPGTGDLCPAVHTWPEEGWRRLSSLFIGPDNALPSETVS